jgi:hypothetical protein
MTTAAVATALTIGLVGAPPPAASADWPFDQVCSISSKILGKWMKGAKTIKFSSAFIGVAGFVAKEACKVAVNQISLGEPASIEVDDGNGFRIAPQRITFTDLQPTRLPAFRPRSVFSDPPAYYDYACSGYRFRVFYDQCVQDRLEPLWD